MWGQTRLIYSFCLHLIFLAQCIGTMPLQKCPPHDRDKTTPSGHWRRKLEPEVCLTPYILAENTSWFIQLIWYIFYCAHMGAILRQWWQWTIPNYQQEVKSEFNKCKWQFLWYYYASIMKYRILSYFGSFILLLYNRAWTFNQRFKPYIFSDRSLCMMTFQSLYRPLKTAFDFILWSSNGFPLFSFVTAMQTLTYTETDTLFELSRTEKA